MIAPLMIEQLIQQQEWSRPDRLQATTFYRTRTTGILILQAQFLRPSNAPADSGDAHSIYFTLCSLVEKVVRISPYRLWMREIAQVRSTRLHFEKDLEQTTTRN